MMITSILVGVFILLLVLFLVNKNKKLQRLLNEKETILQEAESMTNIVCQNVSAYIVLVDKDFYVLWTNYYHKSDSVDNTKPQKLGELLRCKKVLDAGKCSDSDICKNCFIGQAITKAYQEKGEFMDRQNSLRLYLSDEKQNYIDCDVSTSGKYFNMGGKEGVLLTMFDITKLKEIEKELIKAKEQAESSDKLKSAFLANMSHEIRTPLNAIVGFAPLLVNVTDQEEKESYVEIIRSNSELLLQLINDILDLSKIEAGTLEFVYSDVDINAMMKDIEGVFKMRLSAKDSSVHIHFENQLATDIIHTERNRLSQVISNFLTNALKFTDQGSITMGYKVRENDMCFYVTDTGTGIAKENLEDIFKRFTKLDVKKKGTGLGLAISKMIVEKLGGEIGVESVQGKGSTFWFTLPVKPVKTDAFISEKTHESSDVIVVDSYSAKKDKTILVVEDMEDNYLLYEAFLGKKYKLLHAWNGEEAIAIFSKSKPDAIIMDLRMPRMDGYQATEVIRQMSTQVPIIAATAFAFEEDRRKVMESGFNGYLAKPIKADSLYGKLKEIGI